MSKRVVVVIGGGVAGCAAAVGAAHAGARAVLLEPRRHLGGIAAAAEHRTLCGLAPIDAPEPTLLEPSATAAWVALVATGAPFRRGRVWLWPTEARALAAGLARGVAAAGVELRLGATAPGCQAQGEGARLQLSDADGLVRELAADALVDASGADGLARWLGLPIRSARQWGSCRAIAAIPGLDGLSARMQALRRMRLAAGGSAALALEPMGRERWQVSIDIAPDAEAAPARAAIERAIGAVDGVVLAHTIALGRRDQGGAAGDLTLEALFATRERGLCWAAWPREEHLVDGVAWTYPPGARHGVPPSAVRAAGAPPWCAWVGKGMPLSPAAASALRVTGTCLALGDAVGRRVALGEP